MLNEARKFDFNSSSDIREGMTVRSSDGDKLGKIVRVDANGIQVEKGIFFPKEYTATFDQIGDINGDDVYLTWGTSLVENQYDSQYGSGRYDEETRDSSDWTDYSFSGSGNAIGAGGLGSRDNVTRLRSENRESLDTEAKDMSIPVREEELSAEKRGMREVGRIRIHKTVRTEDKHFTVPVRREEIRIERVAANDDQGLSSSGELSSGEAFQEQDITIPIREEEVEITKRAVVKENVRVTTETQQVERPITGTVRKEEVQIDKGGLTRESSDPNRKDLNRDDDLLDKKKAI